MTNAAEGPWICGACRSLNAVRSTRCYKCRTPRQYAQVDPSKLVVAGVGATEATQAVTSTARAAVVGGYESSNAIAGLTQCLLVATGILALIGSVAGADFVGRLVNGETDTARQDAPVILGLSLALYAFAGASLVSWAWWLRSVIANIPRVGLGWPNLSPTQAFIENFLPGWNLFRVPSILRDIVTRLEPGGGRGSALITAAWLSLIGGVLLPYVASRALAFAPTSLQEAVNMDVVVTQMGLGLTLVGIAFLIALIRRIEARMRGAARAVGENKGLQSTSRAPA